jgi:hypothetical protein
MNMATQHCNRTVPRDPRQRPHFATGFTEAGQKRVAQGIEKELAPWLFFNFSAIVLTGARFLLLLFRRLDRSGGCALSQSAWPCLISPRFIAPKSALNEYALGS